MNDTDNTQPAKSKAPSHTAYHVREVNHDESYWTPIGAAWAHKDGKGFSVQLHATPFDGRIVFRVIAEKKS